MSEKSAKRIVEKWQKQVPAEARYDDVKAVIEAYLGSCTRTLKTSGSHLLVVEHNIFRQLKLFDGHGSFSIASHNGKVKKCYVQDVLKAIEVLDMAKRVDEGAD